MSFFSLVNERYETKTYCLHQRPFRLYGIGLFGLKPVEVGQQEEKDLYKPLPVRILVQKECNGTLV